MSPNAAEVLAGRRPTPQPSARVSSFGTGSILDGVASAAGAVGLALLTLRWRRVSDLPGLRVRALMAAHSGVVGDYVA